MNTTNQHLADLAVRHRLWLLRYEAGAVQEVLAAYDEFTGPVSRELMRLLGKLERGEALTLAERLRLLSYREQLGASVRAANGLIRQHLDDRLAEVAETEASVVYNNLRVALPPTADTPWRLTHAARASVGDFLVAIGEPVGGGYWTTRLAVDLLAVHDELQGAIAVAINEGAAIPTVARTIKAATGLTETYRGRMVAIARTEIQRIANTAALESYRQNRDVIGKVQYLATLDSRTCLICAPFHGVEFELDSDGRPVDAPVVPQHHRCRCFYAPVTKTWSEIFGINLPEAEKRRMDGRAAYQMDFEAWLKRQPAAVQLDVLGPTRRAEWLAGSVNLKGFSDQGRVLNLGELRSRYGLPLPTR